MAASDLPDDTDHPIADAYRDHLKHTPNSWAMPQVTASEPPTFEPHCKANLPVPAPKIQWQLGLNDRRFLKSLKIDPEK